MFNPWLWLGAVIFVLVACAGSYSAGSRHATNAAKADYAKQLEQSVKQQRENAVIDMQAAVEAENQRQQTRIEYRDRIVKVGEIIHENPSACTINDAVRVHLNDAITAANTKTAAKPATVPAVAKDTDKQGR